MLVEPKQPNRELSEVVSLRTNGKVPGAPKHFNGLHPRRGHRRF
jgi:hypothetical protein